MTILLKFNCLWMAGLVPAIHASGVNVKTRGIPSQDYCIRGGRPKIDTAKTASQDGQRRIDRELTLFVHC